MKKSDPLSTDAFIYNTRSSLRSLSTSFLPISDGEPSIFSVFLALFGALTLAFREGVKGLGRWVAWCCAGFGASLAVFAFSHTFWLSVILLLPVGYSMMLQMACSNTLIQVMVPDALRGRVMAVYSMMFMGMAPIGALLGGALAERLGAPRTVAIGGLACLYRARAGSRCNCRRFAWKRGA